MNELINIRAIYPTSYSHIKAFEQCPKQFYHAKHLNEYPFTESVDTLYGKQAHKVAEDYVISDAPIPSKFEYMRPVLDALKKKEGNKFAEIKLGITEDLVPCTFFSKQVWIRGIIDLLVVNKSKKLAWVIDYKTSKNAKYADPDQLELMALLVFASYPEVEEIRGGLVFVKCNELVRKKYQKIKRSELWSKWIAKHKKMLEAHKLDRWPTRESGLCRNHCPVQECIHNGANN